MVADNRNVFVTMTLRDQLTGKVKKIQGSLAETRAALDKTAGRVKRTETSFTTLTGNVLKAAPAFAVATAAITAAYQAMRLLRQEFISGLKAVEDFNLRVASMAGFITQFSTRGASGDIVGAFAEANEYAKELIVKLEIIDAKTIATGKDLSIIAETFLKNGQLLDIQNQKQIQGFINIANALKLVTQGQNQEIQMRQEINALMKGQLRATDQLGRLLQKINPNIKEDLKSWAAQGVVIERIGSMLVGMQAAGESIEATWEAVGTSLKTIHDRVLRDAFRPTYELLIGLAEKLRAKYVDQNGELTEAARILQRDIMGFLEDAAGFVNLMWKATQGIITIIKPAVSLYAKIAGFYKDMWLWSADIADKAYDTFKAWKDADPVLSDIEKNYKNIAAYSKAVAAHTQIMQGNTQLSKNPFFSGLGIAEQIGLDQQKVVEMKKTIQVAEIENLRYSKLALGKEEARARNTEKIQKAWEEVTLGVLPEHERRVEVIIRKYDKMREHAKTIYGDTGDFALLEEHMAALNKRQEEAIDRLKETNAVAKDLGFTFASAFEDAVIAGDKLRDILKGLYDDILRILLRMSVTEPMAQGLANILGNLNLSFGSTSPTINFGEGPFTFDSALGGITAKAAGGSAFPGRTYLVGDQGPELLHMGASGNITPNQQVGGGDTYININAVDTRSFSDAIKRNPGSVVSVIREAVEAGDMGLRAALRAGVR